MPLRIDTVDAALGRNGGMHVRARQRHGLPPRADWPRYLASHSPANRIAQRIRAVQQLEDIGSGAVLPLAADICKQKVPAQGRDFAH